MKTLFSRIFMALLLIAAIFAALLFLYLQHPKFGKAPAGERLERIKASPNYQNGKFVNRTDTPDLTEGYSMARVFYNFLFKQNKRAYPIDSIPAIHTRIKNLAEDEDWLIWLGHSSYLIQTDGIKFLVDPVLSENASPVPGSNKAFRGASVFSVEDLPEIDYLIISHDHYDHLDYPAVRDMRNKVNHVICGLGVGAHIEHWGYPPEMITELDWDEDINIGPGIQIYGLTARHFSGRTFKRKNTLWLSYLLETPTRKIYMGGDSGYGSHFREIGELHGPIDLAILENGQYNDAWVELHMHPEEVLQAAVDLTSKRVMPVHSGKFAMAMHDWDEPLKKISEYNQSIGIPLVTPKIGEVVYLNDSTQVFTQWWEGLR